MKTVIEMARKSKLDIYGLGCPHDKFIEAVERFAALVRADKRRACLEIADDCAESDMHASMAANSIRARGNT